MTSKLPHIEPTARYSINETCELLKIHRNTLRRWTPALIKCGYHITGQKFYTG